MVMHSQEQAFQPLQSTGASRWGQKSEGNTRILSRASPGLGWLCGGQAMVKEELGSGGAQAQREAVKGALVTGGVTGGGGSHL
jgi:hypothetical protein